MNSTDVTTRFFELMLRRRHGVTEVARHDEYWGGPAWERRRFGPTDTAEAAHWVQQKGVETLVPAYTDRGQMAAIVHVDARVRTLDLLFAKVSPSLLVARQHDLFGIWLLAEPARWLSGANLSHALARRIPGASARARAPVPGSGNPYEAPTTFEIVSGTHHWPHELEAALRGTLRSRD